MWHNFIESSPASGVKAAIKSVELSTAAARDPSLLRDDTKNGNQQRVNGLLGQEIVQPDRYSALSEPG
ncbi:hypothetical protein ABIE61_000142 [Marinobacterium sp. MBR-111]